MTTSRGIALLLLSVLITNIAAADEQRFIAPSSVPRENFVAAGKNDFFILQPSEQWIYEGVEKGIKTRLVMTVLVDTKQISGVDTRVVEEKRTAAKVATTQRAYFAIDKTTSDVYRFDDRSISLAVPAKPLVGQKIGAVGAGGTGGNVISLTESVKVPAGSFANCLKIRDSVPGTTANVDKFYARGVGMVQIGDLKLIRHGKKKSEQPKQSVEQIDAEPIIPIKLAREALDYVGADPEAEEVWLQAINDPALSAEQRSDLIEDLNETGFSDGNGKRATAEDLPLVISRLELIEQVASDAMDEVNYAAFAEAHKDLVNIAKRLGEQ